MESPFDGALRNDFAIAQNAPDVPIQDHFSPILGEYRSTASLKCYQPLHILIWQSHTTQPELGGAIPPSHNYVVHRVSLFDGAFRNDLLKSTTCSHSRSLLANTW
jgi:hypothetical protein